MKVSLDRNRGNHPNFKGYKVTKDESGFKNIEFALPYDSNRQNVSIVFYKLGKDENNNYFTTGIASDIDGNTKFNISKGVNRFDMAKDFGISDDEPFGYQYRVKSKWSDKDNVYLDAGDSIPVSGKKEHVNIVLPNNSNISKGGAMKLVIPDSQNVGVVYNKDGSYRVDDKLRLKAEDNVKTIWNKMGGTLAGIEKDLDDGKLDNFSRIVGLPIFTRDRLSAHHYWIEDLFQTSPSLGNMNNYASLQRKLFAHDINWVSDGAFVNEGLQGAHFTHMLKWGMDSPFYRWFRAGNRKNSKWTLGIFPKDTRFVTHKLINSPIKYVQYASGEVHREENWTYNPKKPTYIQWLDSRYVTNEELESPGVIINSYSVSSKKDNVYAPHTHNDSIFPVLQEIDPEVYDKNIDNFNKYNKHLPKDKKIKLNKFEGTSLVSNTPNWFASNKYESGYETWDANTDIPKLNFVQSHNDTLELKNYTPLDRQREKQKLLRANAQVQHYIIEAGKFWTKTTDDIIRLYIAQNLKNIDSQNPKKVFDQIQEKADGKIFPKSIGNKHKQILEQEVKNILENNYLNARELSYEDKKSQILEGLMNYPLEAIEFNNNLVSIMSSPMISIRANNLEDVEKSRYEIYKSGNPNLPTDYKQTQNLMTNIYETSMSSYATKVLDEVNKSLPDDKKLFEGEEVTEFGQYTLPLLLPQIAKFSIIKSLAPEVEITCKKDNGEIVYDYEQLSDVCKQSLGIELAVSPTDEANLLLEKLQTGMSGLGEKEISFMKESILKTLQGTNAQSFKLADLIIDKTQAGLDWRIDATKDIADKEAMLSNYMNFEDTWQDVTDFFEKFNRAVRKQNPHSYIVAEVTDQINLWEKYKGPLSAKYPNKTDVDQKLARETGMSAIADYAKYYYNIYKLFARSPEDAKILETSPDGNVVRENPNQLAETLRDILLDSTGKGLFKENSLTSIVHSYTFFANHDKPRPLHCAALDMDMFYSDFTFETDKHRQDAYRLLKDDWFSSPEEIAQKAKNYNFNSASPKAVAMGLHLNKAFIDVLEGYRNKLGKDFDTNYIAINKSLAELCNGRFEGKVFEPDAFGTKPIDVNIEMVLRQARKCYGLNMSQKMEKEYEEKVFEAAMKKAMNKVLAMAKVLAALPGMPTLFDGDDKGATGYERETKNIYVDNRQRVHNEWVDSKNPKYKKFIDDYSKEYDKVMSVRRKAECNALNNGAPFVLPMQKAKATDSNYIGKVPAVLQQSTDGRMTISLFNLHKTHNVYNDYKRIYDNEGDYKPLKLELSALQLNFENENDIKDGAMGIGIAGIEEGTKFQNANDPNDTYTVNECDGKYVLKRDTNGGKITIDDTTLILYHLPTYTKPMTFTGRIKPHSSFVANAYANSIIK